VSLKKISIVYFLKQNIYSFLSRPRKAIKESGEDLKPNYNGKKLKRRPK